MPECQWLRAHIRLFWSSPVFGRKILRKSQSARGPAQCKSGPGNNMVSTCNHLLYIFQYQFTSTSPAFTHKILLKKISNSKGMHIEQNFELRGPGPHGRICTPITGCFHDKAKSLGKSLSGLLITAKILQEAIYFTFPYLGQITYKI